MKVKVMILLFQMMAISNLMPASAHVPAGFVQENVALYGKATQSKILQGKPDRSGLSHAINAIDGNRDSNFFHGSCIRTAGPNAWWRVDLLKTYRIFSVTITNRGDCCGEGIAGSRILIGDSLAHNGLHNPLCSWIGKLARGETRTMNCGKPMKGRYVIVYLPKGVLQVCEVGVNAWVRKFPPPY